MSEQDYLRERRVFEACLERAPAGREAVLAEACGGNVAFRHRIERLLEAHARNDDTLLPLLGRTADLDMPRRIGRYAIVRVLGEGGMGLVYEAEQSEPLARRVALKVIRAGLDSLEVVARFEAERQALAVTDHPNIARVFDAGIAESGRPYFVMELVRGVPLLEYCDRHRLTIRERLALFVPLCLAVHHAHQKGIIHRDLKPANVLVLERDGRPIPKVIDFGVAKAVGHALTARPAVTLHGQLVGTPAYMSPEQADISGMDVDTRSDVYSLGVMLYELLLGALPVDPQEVGVREFLSRLANLETDPPLPSDFLARHLDLRRSAAAKRKADPERLAEELRGDLDSIILKAMEKNRAFRYASANELALDIGRHLRDEPVLARAPTATYRLRKFVRRHRVGVVAAAAVVLALSVGASAMTVGLFRATMAERVARAEADRAHEMELQANQRLRDSLLAQARATRNSRSSGRRHLTLSLLRQAAAIRPGSDLRDEAIAALMLTDLRPKAEWPLPDPDQHHVFEFAPRLDRYLLGFEDGRIEIHSVLGRSVQVLPATGLPVRVARFSSDGTKLAVKYHGASETGPAAFSVWNVDSGRKLLSYEGGIAKRAFDFSPDDRSIAYVTLDRKLIHRDLVSGRILLRKVLESVPYAIKFRPDGAALAFALQNKSLLVIGLNGAERRQIECQAVPTSLDWDKEGRLLGAGFYDYSASIWDVETGRRTSTLQGHQAEVVAILFNPTAPIVATYSWDETSRLWELATGREILVVGAQVRGFSRDGRAASFLTRQAAGIWEVLHGDTFRVLHGHSGKSPVSLQFGTDASRIVSAGPDGAIVWDAESGRKLVRVPAAGLKDAIFDPQDGSVVTCGDQGSTKWANIEDGQSRDRPRATSISARPCTAVAGSTSGSLWAFLETPNTRITFRAGTAELLLDAFPGMSDVEVSPEGAWVAGGNWRGDRTQVWNATTGAVAARLLPGTSSVNVRFSPDGRWLATGSSDDYRLWHTGSWEQALVVPRPLRFSDLPGQLDFSQDSRLLALQIDQTHISAVQIPSGEVAWQIEMPEPQAITGLRFSGDGRRLAAATSTNQILVWDLDKLQEALRSLEIDDLRGSFWPSTGDSASLTQDGRMLR